MTFRHQIPATLLAASLLAGPTWAQDDNTDDVVVTLSVDVARAVEIGFDGDVALTNEEFITDPDPSIFANYLTGITTGCIHLNGTNNIDIQVTGANTPPGVVGPFLGHTDAGGASYYLYYQPVIGFGAPGADFSTLLIKHRNANAGSPDITATYWNFDGNAHTNGHTVRNGNALAELGGSTESGCPTGNNMAFGAMVGIDGGGHEDDQANNIYGDINTFQQVSGVPDGTYLFSDTVTVTITPVL